MTRTGKIARLPREIRDDLNRRLERNIPGITLVDWLNSLPEVQEVVQNLFEGKPISPQNLSEWRHGGFAEWQAENDFLERLRDLAISSETIEATCGHMADHAARVLSARMALIIANPSSSDDALANLKHLTPLVRNLTLLRRADHSAARLKLAEQTLDLARKDHSPTPIPEATLPTPTHTHTPNQTLLFSSSPPPNRKSNQIKPLISTPPKPEPKPRPETQSTTETPETRTQSNLIKPQISPPANLETNRGPEVPYGIRAVQRGTSGPPGKRPPESPTSPARETSAPLTTPIPTDIVTQPNVTISPEISPAAPSPAPASLTESELWQLRHRALPSDPTPDWRIQLPIKTALPSWFSPLSYKIPPPPTRARVGR